MSGFNLSDWAIRNRSVTIFIMLAALVAGVSSFYKLGRAEDPPFTFRTMVVRAIWPGATLDETIQQVTERLERTLQEVPNLDNLRSFTRAGTTTIFVDLVGSTQGRAVSDTWYEVRKKVGDMRHTLPQGIVGPFFNDEFGDTFGIIYAFTADGFSHRELRDAVENARSELLLVPDVSKIDILGAQDEVIFIDFSAERLAGLGFDPSTLLAALRAQNIVSPAGVLSTSKESIALRVSGAFGSEQDIAEVTFAVGDRMLRLRDIADVRRGFTDPPQPMFRIDGEPAIGLAIAMRDGGDTLALGRNVAKAIAEIKADLPHGIEPRLVADQPLTVDLAINEFTASLWQAIAIVLVVSFIALGVRAGTVVAVAIPLTLAVVFPMMDLVDIDLQRVSLGALIIALALMVDDAMTTIDAMSRRLALGDDKASAATYAYKHLSFAMLIGTLVTIAGFVPIGFAQSSAGEYTFSIFAVVGIALIASWLVAMVFAPLIGMVLLRPPKSGQGDKPNRTVEIYRGFLTLAMRARWVTIALTVAIFVAAIAGLGQVPRQFFPSSDRPELLVDLRLPQNASIHATERLVDEFEQVLRDDPEFAPEIERWSTYIGQGAIRFYLPLDVQLANPFFAQAVIVTKDIEARERLQPRLEKLLGGAIPPGGWAGVAAGAGAAGRLAGPVSRPGPGPDPASRHRHEARGPGRGQPGYAARQFRLDGAGARAAYPGRPGAGASAGPELTGGLHRAQRQYHRLRHHPGPGRHLSRQRGGTRGGGTEPLGRDPAQPAGLAPQRTHHPAQPVCDLRVRSGLPAGVATRPGADPDRSGGRGPWGHARDRGRGPGAAHRRAERDPAGRLPHRAGRLGRGERRFASARSSRWSR